MIDDVSLEEDATLWQVEIIAEKDQAFAVMEKLEDHCYSLSIFEQENSPHLEKVIGLSTSPLEKSLIEKVINDTCTLGKNSAQATYHISQVPKIDWLFENRKSFPAQTIGCFYVHGTHHQPSLEADLITLKIDASTAFGTGTHQTTQGCLRALENFYLEGLRPQKLLDLGTGTGILAIAMAKLFGVNVLAIDNDMEAVEKAIFNAELNQVKNSLSVCLGEGIGEIEEPVSFDLICANILAGPLIEMAGQLQAGLSPQGVLILSGILAEQEDSVKDAYQARGINLTYSEQIGDWVTLCFKRQGPQAL